uniref:Integrase core domain containing protein n=1 Tax=Solanum tuberosum TaxID=4113 RepID=M1DY12_SOLTU
MNPVDIELRAHTTSPTGETQAPKNNDMATSVILSPAKSVSLKVFWYMKQESDLKLVLVVTRIVELGSEVSIEERLDVDALATVMMNFEGDGIEDYDDLVVALDRGSRLCPAYVPPTTRTSPTVPSTTRNQTQQLIPDVVTASQSDKEDTPIGSPAGSAYGSEFASASSSGSASGSSSQCRTASSDKATSAGVIPMPSNTEPAPIADEPNRWCVSGQWQIYRDAWMMTEKDRMARLVTDECLVLTGSLHTALAIHELFKRHMCDWMARNPGSYNEKIVREFYASYATTLRGSI